MKVYSFVRKGIDLEEIEIEVSLVPGLPAFHLIGLPDASIKESILRIKSALRHQGFKLPNREQVLIHLKPSYERKSSQGLDLAIAAAYLMKTEQIDKTVLGDKEKIYLYGEVSLEGAVTSPQDIELLEDIPEKSLLVTGQHDVGLNLHHGLISELKDLANIKWREAKFDSSSPELQPSPYSDYEFAKPIAELLAVTATGEHNIFLAGPAGTGKTTFCGALHSLLRKATPNEQKRINKIAKITKKEIIGRPYISPHHSASDIALLGGGVPAYPGEVTRAQHGVLVLDEFLLFANYVKESLREPIERHEITVCRSGAKITFPADFLLVGATNLCPCGEYIPNVPAPCGQNSTRCKSYYLRLSGPLLDRFEIVNFTHKWRAAEREPIASIRERVARAQAFALETRGQTKMNARLSLRECEALMAPFARK